MRLTGVVGGPCSGVARFCTLAVSSAGELSEAAELARARVERRGRIAESRGHREIEAPSDVGKWSALVRGYGNNDQPHVELDMALCSRRSILHVCESYPEILRDHLDIANERP